MTKKEIWEFIDKQLKLKKKKHPASLEHLVAQAALVAKESGKLIEQCLDKKYNANNATIDNYLIKEAAAKTIVAAYRILEKI